MTFGEIVTRIEAVTPGVIEETVSEGTHPHVRIGAGHVLSLSRTLKEDPEFQFEMLHCVSGVDWPDDDQLEVVYHLFSLARKHGFAFKVRLPRAEPVIDSIVSIWPAADWHERETYDMYGILFDGHPHLKRILLPEDWIGYPLLKDYEMPKEYHGIPGLGSDLGRTM